MLNNRVHPFRLDLESGTDALTAPAWIAMGGEATIALYELLEPHHDSFVARINATAGLRWMPAVRQGSTSRTGHLARQLA